jgi:hypothetical protein
MSHSRSLPLIALLILPLGLFAALAGLFWAGAAPPALEVTSVRGEAVTLYGQGVYRYNSLMLGAGFPAQDVVLIIALAVLGWGVFLYLRGQDRSLVIVLGVLGYLWYVYASMALGAALDWLFPGYVALFSASSFALWLAGREGLGRIDPAPLPRRGLAVFLAMAGLATLAIWAPSIVADLAAGRTPPRLDTQTTKITHALDLGLIVPLCFIAAVKVWRGQAMGQVIALPLLGCLVGLFPWIVLATIFQIRAGVEFTTPEMIGPIGGFAVLGLGGAWFLHQAWRAMHCGGPATAAS